MRGINYHQRDKYDDATDFEDHFSFLVNCNVTAWFSFYISSNTSLRKVKKDVCLKCTTQGERKLELILYCVKVDLVFSCRKGFIMLVYCKFTYWFFCIRCRPSFQISIVNL
jgi:hypothetical protein